MNNQCQKMDKMMMNSLQTVNAVIESAGFG